MKSAYLSYDRFAVIVYCTSNQVDIVIPFPRLVYMEIFVLGYTCQMFVWLLWSRSHDSYAWRECVVIHIHLSHSCTCIALTSCVNGSRLDASGWQILMISATRVIFTDSRSETDKCPVFEQVHRFHDVGSIHNWYVYVKYPSRGNVVLEKLCIELLLGQYPCRTVLD